MSLANFVFIEFNKVKGNRTFIITVIGALLIPILVAIASFFIPGISIVDKISGVYTFYLQFGLSIIFSAVIINYLFTIDLETHALKSIIPLPISRNEYIVGKLATLLVWMIVLSLITFVASFILLSLSGTQGFDLMAILKDAAYFLVATALLFVIMIPVAFVTVFTNNTSAGLVVSVLLLFSTAIPIEQMTYNPWSLPYKVMFSPSEINVALALGIIVLVGIIGFFLLRKTFFMRDIQL